MANSAKKGGDKMNSNRTEWQIRCTFNGFCKSVLRNETIDMLRKSWALKKREVVFSELAQHEANQLYTNDKYFRDDTAQDFYIAGKRISEKLLTDALRILPEEKRIAIMLYYIHSKTDAEISEILSIPRSTAQYRRTSSFSQLRRFMEEHADEWIEWQR